MLRLLLLVALSSAAVAQPSVGVRGGLNVAWWESGEDTGLREGSRLRFVGGLTSQFEIAGSVGARAEALYAQKGAEIANGTVRYRADYLEVPLLVTNAVALGGLRADLEAGVALAVPLRGRFDLDPPEPVEGLPNVDPIDVPLEGDLDLQTDVGAAVGVRVGRGPVGLGVRYTHGLRNVIDSDTCDEFAGDPMIVCSVIPWKNRALAVTASVRLR